MSKLSREQYEMFEQNGVWADLDMVGGRDFIEMNPVKDLVAFYQAISDQHPSETHDVEIFMDEFSAGRWFEFKKFVAKYERKLKVVSDWKSLMANDEMIEDGEKIAGTISFPLLYPYIAWKYVRDDKTDDDLSLDDFDSMLVEKYTPMGVKYITNRKPII